MTVKELKEIAKTRGLKGYSKMKKAQKGGTATTPATPGEVKTNIPIEIQHTYEALLFGIGVRKLFIDPETGEVKVSLVNINEFFKDNSDSD